MRSYPLLIRDMRRQPEFAHKLFTFIVDDVLIPYLKVQKEYCGVTVARGADAWASVPNLSVNDMKEWVVPYNQRMITGAAEYGISANSNSGDYNEERPEKFDTEIVHGSFDVEIASQGSPSLFLGMGRWEEYPLEPVRDYTAKYRNQGTSVRITAGVNARLLRDGPIEKIVSTVKRFIDAFGRDHVLSIFLSNLPMDTPPAHVHTAIAAAHIYGRKPIAEHLDEIEFSIPERETFQEWKKRVQ